MKVRRRDCAIDSIHLVGAMFIEQNYYVGQSGKMKVGGNFGDELYKLANRAYPEFRDSERECLALAQYLNQVTHPMIAIAVRQRRPKTITEALHATIEMQTYVSRNDSYLSNSHNPSVGEQSVQKQTITNLMCSQQNLNDMLRKLASRIESLENVLNQRKPDRKLASRIESLENVLNQRKLDVSVVCKNCDQLGHYARGCAYDRSRHLRKSRGHRQGNQVRRDGHTCSGTQSGIVKDVSNIITIGSVSKYSLNVYISGVCVPFLVDTGAAASLIDGKVWDSIKVLSDI